MPTFSEIRDSFPGARDLSDEEILKRISDLTKLPIHQVADDFGYDVGSGGKNAKRLSASIDQYQSNLYGVGEDVTKAAGLTGASEFLGRQRQRNAIQADVASGRAHDMGSVDSWADVHGPRDFADYATGLGIQSLPYAAEAIVGGAVGGATLPSTFARMGLAGERAVEAARMAGVVAGSYPSSVGDILQNQREQTGGQTTDLLSAAAYGVPYAAANVFGIEGTLGRGQLFRNGIKALDEIPGIRGAAARTGSSMLRTGAEEGGNETFQEFMNQAGRMAVDPSQSFSSDDSNNRFYESGVGGAVLGALTAGVAGGWRRSHAYTVAPTNLLPDATPQETTYTTPGSLTNTPVTDMPGFASQQQDPLQQQIGPLGDRFRPMQSDVGPSVTPNPNPPGNPPPTPPAGAAPGNPPTNAPGRVRGKQQTEEPPVSPQERQDASDMYRVESVLDDGTDEGHWRVFGKDFFNRADLNNALDKQAIEDRGDNPAATQLAKQLNAAGPAISRPKALKALAASLVGSTPEKTAYNLDAAIKGGIKDADRLAAVYEEITGNESPAWKALQQPTAAKEKAPAATATTQPSEAANQPTAFADDDFEGMARATLMKLFNGNETNTAIALADLRGDKPADIQKQYGVSDSQVRKIRSRLAPKALEIAARQAGVPLEKLGEAFAKREAGQTTEGETRLEEGTDEKPMDSDERPLHIASDEELSQEQQEADTHGTAGMSLREGTGAQIADASTRNNSRAKLEAVHGKLSDKSITVADLNNLYIAAVEADDRKLANDVEREVLRRHKAGELSAQDLEDLDHATEDADQSGSTDLPAGARTAEAPGRRGEPAAQGKQNAAVRKEAAAGRRETAAGQGSQATAPVREAAGKKQPKGKVGTAWDKLQRQLAAAKVEMPAWESLTPEQQTKATDQFALNGKIGVQEAQKVVGSSPAATPTVAPKIDEKSAATVAKIRRSTAPSTKEATGADLMAKLNKAAEEKKNAPTGEHMDAGEFIKRATGAAALAMERLPKKGDTLHFNDSITQHSEVRRNQTFVVDRVEDEPRRGWVVYGRLFNKNGEEETQPGITIKYPDGTTVQHGDGTERFSLANFKETNKLWQDLQRPRTLGQAVRDQMTGTGVPRGWAMVEAEEPDLTPEDRDRSYGHAVMEDFGFDHPQPATVVDDVKHFFMAHMNTRTAGYLLGDAGIGNLMKGLDGLMVVEDEKIGDTARGMYLTYVSGTKKLAIAASQLREDNPNGTFVLLHEIGHSADLAGTHYPGQKGFFSGRAELQFHIDYMGEKRTLIPLGAVANELHALWKQDSPRWNFLSYPFDLEEHGRLKLHNVQREVFAQLFAAYMVHPEQMKVEAPLAYRFMQRAIEDIKARNYEKALRKAKAHAGYANNSVERSAIDDGRAGFVSEAHEGGEAATLRPGQAGRQAAGRGREGRAQAGRQAERFIEALPQASRTGARKLWTTISDAAKKGFYGAAFTWDLADLAANKLPSVTNYMTLMGKKSAVKTALEDQVEKILAHSEKIPKTDRLGRQQTGTGEHSINKFLYDSTLSGKWGYQDDPASNIRVDPELAARFQNFSDDAQALIRTVFKYGADTLRMKQRIIKDEINNEYRALARESGNDPEKLEELERKRRAALQHYDSILFLTANKPYSPLRRFGNYVTIARSQQFRDAMASNDSRGIERMQSDENHYHVSFHETLGEAEEVANRLKATGSYADTSAFEKEKGLAAIHGGRDMMTAFQRLRNLIKSELETDPNDQVAKSLNGMISDLYLQTLAETSARKAEIKRRNVAGADLDMLRAFATQGRADAHFIAALKHNGEVTDSMYEMRREAHEPGDDKAERMRLFNEFMARHALHMDYRETRVQDAILRGTSLWMLATSPAYYLQNATQTPMISVPYLAGKHGYGRSWGAVMQAFKDLGPMSRGLNWADRMDLTRAPADVQRMLNDLVSRGSIDIALDQDLGRFQSRADSSLAHGWNVVDRKLRGMAQRVEAINRVTAAISAYRMELARNGGNHAAATDYAAKVVRVTHGDYSSFNAPRYLTPGGGLPAAKVLTQFRKFQIIQASLIVRLFNNAFGGSVSPQERAVARKALFFTLGHTAAIGGMYGLPGVTTLAWVVAKLFGDPDEPDDDELKLRRMIGNEDISDLILKGAPAYFGVDLSGKLGMGNSFGLMPYTKLDTGKTSDDYKNALLGLSGPFLGGILPRFADGVDMIGRGNWYKGMEQMLPSGFANVAKSYRYATEGVTRKSGDTMMEPEEVSTATEMAQALGLQTKQLTDRTFDQKVVSEFEQFYKDKTNRLTEKYARAAKKGDTEGMQETRDQWMDLQESRLKNGFPRQPLSTLLKAPVNQAKRERQVVNHVGAGHASRQLAEELGEI
jgi:hypothetical protein